VQVYIQEMVDRCYPGGFFLRLRKGGRDLWCLAVCVARMRFRLIARRLVSNHSSTVSFNLVKYPLSCGWQGCCIYVGACRGDGRVRGL
jgi:hypothetical protein